MIGLKEFILESETKFEHQTDNFEYLLSNSAISRRSSEYKDVLGKLFKEINVTIFIYSIKRSYFKIPYLYNESLLKVIGEYDKYFKYSKKGIKIIVYSLDNKELFETGSGSIGRVSVIEQEKGTCLVWNKFVEEYNKSNSTNLNDLSIKELVEEISSNFDSSWIKSFYNQVLVLKDFLGKEFNKYKMCRYGEDEIGIAYKNFTMRYKEHILKEGENKKIKVNSLDPTDVIIYDNSKDVCSLLNNLDGQSKDEYKKLIDDKILIGVSLKKIPGSNKGYTKFNMGDNNIGEVKEFEVLNDRENNIRIDVKYAGDFKFGDYVDSDMKYVKNTKTIRITMRTFGSGRVGVDCSVYNDKDTSAPSLGKCPVDIWRSILKCDKNDDITECIKKFRNFLNNGPNQKLTEIIRGAVKEGPYCLPFVLIN